MESIVSSTSSVHFGTEALTALSDYLAANDHSKVFVLVDEHTRVHCLPILLEALTGASLDGILEIPSGEINKTIGTCQQVWQALSEHGADRKSLLINLGGGVLTDLGGFVASTFKRGMEFINIPTTLLAMVDASVGGKTGVDFGSLKNQIGVINQPTMVLVHALFLETLEERQLNSGFAEMLKHGLIQDAAYWQTLKSTKGYTGLEPHIHTSVRIKNAVVLQDPTEKGLRKILNFGHTLGHAVESYFLDHPQKETLLHGEAIAVGMILEAYLSHKLTGLSQQGLQDIKDTFMARYPKVAFSNDDINAITTLLRHDKKNSHGQVNFMLLKDIGHPILDVVIPDHHISDAFAYYKV